MQKGRTFQDSSIGNFIFIITPTQAHITRATKNKRTLTLQKGMQTLGTLQQCIPIISKDSKKQYKHNFTPLQHSITFRVINDKNLNYQWTVYNVLDGGKLQEMDCMQFSIQSFWKSFVGEYEKNVANLLLRTKEEKDSKKMLEVWKELLGQSHKRSDNMRVVFGKADFTLDFKIQARSVLDKQLQEYEAQKVVKKQRQVQKSQIRKSTITLSNIGQEDFTSDQIKIIQKLRRGKTQLGDKLNSNILSLNNRNFFSPIKQRIEPMKKALSHNDAAIGNYQKSVHKAQLADQVQQQSLAISSQLKKSVKKSNSIQQILRQQSLKDLDREQNLQLSSKIKHQKATALVINAKKQDSPVDNVKVVIIYVVLGIVMLWLIYHLMGHHSKVEYRK